MSYLNEDGKCSKTCDQWTRPTDDLKSCYADECGENKKLLINGKCQECPPS